MMKKVLIFETMNNSTSQKTSISTAMAMIIAIFISCNSPLPVKNEVIVHYSSDPAMLNPCNTVDATTGYIVSYMYQKLVDADFRKPGELVPVIAEARPIIEKTPDGKMRMTFRIRKEAKWDNGSPITTADIEFSIKTVLNPLVDNTHAKPYFSFMKDFELYPDDPQKFTIVSDETYFLAEATITDVFILPEYVYDPKGLMRNFTLKQISANPDSLRSDARIKEFADDFNSEKRMRDPNFISGSGAYRFTEWKTNERVILVKKENWWGDALASEHCLFEAYPDKLIFQTIKDPTTAIVALKAGNLDVMHGIKTKDFAELPKSEKFMKAFNTYTPMEYSYVYLGINMKKPHLSDKLTRQALAHAMNVEEVIKVVKYGEGQRIVGPIHPSKKKVYNSSLQPYAHDLEKAKALLEQAGWKNTNGDATVDKVINGKRQEFVIDFIVNAGNEERKSIALMFQEQAKKIGIEVKLQVIDWAVFLTKASSHDFDMLIGKWVSSPHPDDMIQIYHSSSVTEGGSNYCNFSNAEADQLMDTLRVEINEEKRNRIYLRMQEILHEEVPMIYMYTPLEHIAISKKYENAPASEMRPGYWLPGFRMKEGAAGQ